ncbi:AAA family ATPase (plasmid) [Vibrio scophthalmi]|uniref:AAA family ATPase n=1 Tax=Vibrio scophthalmi TaxID=45658 RepID=UPI003EBB4F10
MTAATAAQLETVTQIDYSEMEPRYLRDVFKPFIPAEVDLTIMVPKHRHPDVPREVPNFVPNKEQMNQVLAWFVSPARPCFLHLVGPTGSGKTDFMMWLCSRLNWPTSLISVNPTLRPDKMQGRWVLIDGKTVFVYGPVADAMKNGKCVILDECDKASMDFIAKMHLPSEMTKPWTLEDTGEVIYPHPNFRFITTGNTSGEGDVSGLYPSSRRWDTAFRNRSFIVTFPYLPAAIEEKVLIGKYPFLKGETMLVKKMLQFANAMRDAMLGPNRDRVHKTGISTAFSTRVLLNWAYYIETFGANAPLGKSFEAVFFAGCDSKDKADIQNIVDTVFKVKDVPLMEQPFTYLRANAKK